MLLSPLARPCFGGTRRERKEERKTLSPLDRLSFSSSSFSSSPLFRRCRSSSAPPSSPLPALSLFPNRPAVLPSAFRARRYPGTPSETASPAAKRLRSATGGGRQKTCTRHDIPSTPGPEGQPAAARTKEMAKKKKKKKKKQKKETKKRKVGERGRGRRSRSRRGGSRRRRRRA